MFDDLLGEKKSKVDIDSDISPVQVVCQDCGTYDTITLDTYKEYKRCSFCKEKHSDFILGQIKHVFKYLYEITTISGWKFKFDKKTIEQIKDGGIVDE